MISPKKAAMGMLSRYSSTKKALEMAVIHSQDYPVGSKMRKYWMAVEVIIKSKNKLNPRRRAKYRVRKNFKRYGFRKKIGRKSRKGRR